MTTDSAASQQSLQRAAYWYALLRDGQASASRRRAWQRWLEQSEDNRCAWQQMQQLAGQFAQLQDSAGAACTVRHLQQAEQRLLQRRQVLRCLLGLVAVGAGSSLAMHCSPLPGLLAAWRADYRTATGERRRIALAQGGELWLNTRSALDLRQTAAGCQLRLLSGEVFVDSRTQLSLQTPDGQLLCHAARFNLQIADNGSRLAVYHGHLQLGSTRIEAGEQVRFRQSRLSREGQASASGSAWTRGLLIAQDISLREVVAQMRRYHRGHIVLAEEIAELRVFGTFPVAETTRMLSMLASVLPVQSRQPLPWWISIEPRAS